MIARDFFVASFSSAQLQSLHYHLPKIIFICGGDEKFHPNRKIIEEYFRLHHKKFLTFRAEDAWIVISKNSSSENALAHEEWLAGFSDVVMILVESYGTVAELGAFSLNEQLRKKLLPVLDINYQNEASFINTGPVRWINSDSKFRPCIYTNFKTILTVMPEIEKRINRTVQESVSPKDRFGKFGFTNKVMLFFTLQILVVIGPITTDEIVNIVSNILQERGKRRVEFILAVGVALGIFKIHSKDGADFYYCKDFERLFSAENTKRLLHRIQLNRGKALSSLIGITEYKKLLLEIHGDFA